MTALETAEVLGDAQPGKAGVRGKADRERTVFLDANALQAIRAYVKGRGPGDTRRWVFPMATAEGYLSRRRTAGSKLRLTCW